MNIHLLLYQQGMIVPYVPGTVDLTALSQFGFSFLSLSLSLFYIYIIDTFLDNVMSIYLTKTEIIAGSVDGTVRTFDIRNDGTVSLYQMMKEGHNSLLDYAWSSGDQVDVWVQDSWHEAIVMDTNKIDLTSLTVQFPAQSKASIVRSWHVRPTLVWKDDK
ncbi:unnamed protein product [Lactuca saligna]|uniref:Agenet domain-containing protein n=1 Tax=Lactuca saligna TaxID=75948 RepID=A0AA35YXY1_LACSI|nr:unnamed protein product [Lactuca saligna]